MNSQCLSVMRNIVLAAMTSLLLLVQMIGMSSQAMAQRKNLQILPPKTKIVTPLKITAFSKIHVQISDYSMASGYYLVDTSGKITLRFDTGGEKVIPISGLTECEAALVINRFVYDELKNPPVTVKLTETRDQAKFSVMGAVARAGTYSFDPRLRLGDVLNRAGGLTLEAERIRATLFRHGKAYALRVSPLRIAYPDPGQEANPQIEPDDVIFIRPPKP